jgi:hypothetical protein
MLLLSKIHPGFRKPRKQVSSIFSCKPQSLAVQLSMSGRKCGWNFLFFSICNRTVCFHGLNVSRFSWNFRHLCWNLLSRNMVGKCANKHSFEIFSSVFGCLCRIVSHRIEPRSFLKASKIRDNLTLENITNRNERPNCPFRKCSTAQTWTAISK